MKNNSKSIGERSEAIILAHILKLGYSASIPFGNNQRYDMILDDGEKLFKVQCKTGRLIQGCVSFSVASKNGFTKKRKSYHGDVDLFLVHCDGVIYRIPISDVPTNEMRLRIEPLKPTAPTSTVRWAKDYIYNSKNENL